MNINSIDKDKYRWGEKFSQLEAARSRAAAPLRQEGRLRLLEHLTLRHASRTPPIRGFQRTSRADWRDKISRQAWLASKEGNIRLRV